MSAPAAAPGIGEPLPHLLLADCIYLDYNATTPIFPEVQAAMQPYTYEAFGNPSSTHAYGQRTAAALAHARAAVAKLVNAESPDEVYFTACGTESDNWAIWGAVAAARSSNGTKVLEPGVLPHVVTSAIEHPAVLAYLEALKELGLCTFTAVGVNQEGLVCVEDVQAAMRPETVLVTVMHSNNEVGSIQPVEAIAAVAREGGALLHSDAAQSIGKVPVDVQQLGVDMLTIVGHKFGAPKGVAALYIRQGVQIGSLLHGGGQERGMRAGTESVLLISGLGAAAEVACRDLEATSAHMRSTRDDLQNLLLEAFSRSKRGVRINGPADEKRRLPNTLSISIGGLKAGALLGELRESLAASAAAACHSGSEEAAAASPVLKAMAVPAELAAGTLRLSTGRHTTAEEVRRAVGLIAEAAGRQGVTVVPLKQ